jgi:hypothetical protein
MFFVVVVVVVVVVATAAPPCFVASILHIIIINIIRQLAQYPAFPKIEDDDRLNAQLRYLLFNSSIVVVR